MVLADLRGRDGRRQLLTKPKPESELAGLVYGVGAMPHEEPVVLWKRPIFWAAIVIVVFFVLNLMVW